jgi:type IV pilus assembly protein PilA
MKTLQKGFSLVELLVVVAIIGVLAGVGIVGYQGYTDSAKERVAIANYNSVSRFIETELTLLNNNIQTTSAAIKEYTTDCATTSGTSTPQYDNTDSTHTLAEFLQGIMCYFDATNGYGSSFKNPYASTKSQVVYNQSYATSKHGEINLGLVSVVAESRSGVPITQADITLSVGSTRGGTFIIEYFDKAASGTTGEKKGKKFTLK